MGLGASEEALNGSPSGVPPRQVLALPGGGSPRLGATPQRRAPGGLTCRLQSNSTQRKLYGPSLEERWLEEVFSKAPFSSVASAVRSGWRVGGRMLSRLAVRLRGNAGRKLSAR